MCAYVCMYVGYSELWVVVVEDGRSLSRRSSVFLRKKSFHYTYYY